MRSGSASVRLLFPMVTNLEELVYLRATVERAKRQLLMRGIEPVEMPVGVMVEVPAAALVIDQLLEFVDFVSIGSNDLVQYVMAADRDNPKVNHLCQPLAPPMLRLISSVVNACRQANKPVTLCGEMAGQPEAVALLLGMGLERLSMSPALVPTIKELVARVSRSDAAELLREAMLLRHDDRDPTIGSTVRRGRRPQPRPARDPYLALPLGAACSF